MFSTRGSLYMHRRLHFDIRPYGCGTCARTFRSKLNLRTHMVRYHADRAALETFVCALCQESFPIGQNLNLHLRQRHPAPSPPPSECRECGETFDTQNLLKSHRVAVHTERRLECGVCGKRFLWPAHLRDHARSHSKEKPFR